MKEHPILFRGPMVRAILEGRKTQTRRLVKFDVMPEVGEPVPARAWVDSSYRRASMGNVACLKVPYLPEDPADETVHRHFPKWEAGERLWVKETHAVIGDEVLYRADGAIIGCHKWKPSIFCTRAASRLTLEVEGVRAERLQNISEADALLEGVVPVSGIIHGSMGRAQFAFAELWESINGKASWEANPWVWVIDFKRL